MEVAAQHSERERVAARETVEERLFLGGVGLQRRDVAGRSQQRPFLIEAHLADAAAPRLHEAAMPAGEAAHRAVREALDQLGFANPRIQDLGERGRAAVGQG
jgi:hypothetical protein